MKWWGGLVPVVLALALFLPLRSNQLVWDDDIVQKRQMVVFQSLRDVFFPPSGIREWATAYYRPVVVLTYLLDQWLFGRADLKQLALGAKATLATYHALCVFFVWMLARRVLAGRKGGEPGAIAAGALFAVHPIHTESVCWITGRSDTIAALFMLPALLVALRFRDRPSAWALLLAPFLYLLAVLSKEVALATVPLVPVLFWLVPRAAGALPDPAAPPMDRATRRRLAREGGATRSGNPLTAALRDLRIGWTLLAGLFVVATMVYFLMRAKAGIQTGHRLDIAPSGLLGRAAAALSYYLWFVVVPYPQSSFPTELPGGWLPGAGVATLVALAVVAIWSWRRREPTLLLALAWFLLSIAPSVAVAVRQISETPVAERYLYVPSVALSLVFGAAVAAAALRRKLLVPVASTAVALIAVYGYGTLARAAIWQDNLALWSDTARRSPNVSLPHHWLGMTLMDQGKLDEAIGHFETALRVRNNPEKRGLAHNNIGMCHWQMGRLELAEAHFQQAIAERPNYETPYYGLGAMAVARVRAQYERDGTIDLPLVERARQFLLQAIKLSPRYSKALNVLSTAYQFQAISLQRSGNGSAARAAMLEAKRLAEMVVQFEGDTALGRGAQAQLRVINSQLGQP